MADAVGPEVVELWERLFCDEASKDVRIIAKGQEELRVHGVLLANLSEPFRAMLSHDMAESRTKTVDLTGFTKEQLSFFFRFAYTGQVDPADWTGGAMPEAARVGNGLGAEARGAGERTRRKRDPRVLLAEVHAMLGIADTAEPPLELLLGAAALSKQYDVQGFLPKLVEKLKDKLSARTFNEIARFAIARDIAPLRMRCLAFAQTSDDVLGDYREGKLSPEVAFELQAVFPAAGARKRKLFF